MDTRDNSLFVICLDRQPTMAGVIACVLTVLTNFIYNASGYHLGVRSVILMAGIMATLLAEDNPRSPLADSVPKPAWAATSGVDQFGTWADLTVDTGTQRFRWIHPGVFTMGLPQAEMDALIKVGMKQEWLVGAEPHKVTISKGYWMADSSCTQGLWRVVTGKSPSYFTGNPERPVDQVSWIDVQEFMKQLNGTNAGRQFRLPTEAEWEYACRAGTTTATYAGDLDYRGENNSPTLDAIAWYGGNSGHGWSGENGFNVSLFPEKQYPETTLAGTWPVRQRRPNAWGLYDMLGNVYQWCGDWLARYPGGEQRDPVGPLSGLNRVTRGISWGGNVVNCRSAFRSWNMPDHRANMIGFRIIAPSAP